MLSRFSPGGGRVKKEKKTYENRFMVDAGSDDCLMNSTFIPGAKQPKRSGKLIQLTQKQPG